jgi:hypothetical protein
MQHTPAAQVLTDLHIGRHMLPALFKLIFGIALLFGPAYTTAYLVTWYRPRVLRAVPFGRQQIVQTVVIIWLFIACFTYLPALVRLWLSW